MTWGSQVDCWLIWTVHCPTRVDLNRFEWAREPFWMVCTKDFKLLSGDDVHVFEVWYCSYVDCKWLAQTSVHCDKNNTINSNWSAAARRVQEGMDSGRVQEGMDSAEWVAAVIRSDVWILVGLGGSNTQQTVHDKCLLLCCTTRQSKWCEITPASTIAIQIAIL